MKKTLITILATVLVCCCVVGGTLAWLMDETEAVVNTFTVGNVDITLAESVDTNSDNAESFKMVPGSTIKKDPLVTVVGGSEDCWLFIEITESSTLDTYISYAIATGWTALDGEDGVYYRKVTASTENQTFNVLGADANGKWAVDQVYVNDTVTKDLMDDLNEANAVQPTLTFKAYAVQSENVDAAADAWDIAKPTT